jgi:hypothetical protein
MRSDRCVHTLETPAALPKGVADIHTHPITPRTTRLTLQLAF